jgi:hypothetical protein
VLELAEQHPPSGGLSTRPLRAHVEDGAATTFPTPRGMRELRELLGPRRLALHAQPVSKLSAFALFEPSQREPPSHGSRCSPTTRTCRHPAAARPDRESLSDVHGDSAWVPRSGAEPIASAHADERPSNVIEDLPSSAATPRPRRTVALCTPSSSRQSRLRDSRAQRSQMQCQPWTGETLSPTIVGWRCRTSPRAAPRDARRSDRDCEDGETSAAR